MQYDNDTQISTGPDTQVLMQLVQYRNNQTPRWLLDSQLRSEINSRLDFLDSHTLSPDDELNNNDFPPIIDSQFTSGYDPEVPYMPAWAPTPYRRSLVPTLPAPGPLFLEPFKKAALIKEGTAEAYLKLFQHGEIEARVDEKGSWELRCIAECWVRTGISARIPLTTKGQFAVLEAHARGKSCKANTQKSAIQESRLALTTIFPSRTASKSLRPSESNSTAGPFLPQLDNLRCPGLNGPGSTVSSTRISSLSIAGSLVEPANPPILDASEHLPLEERQQINSKCTTWVIGDEALKEVIVTLWKRITDNKIALTTIPGLSGLSKSFPYCDLSGSASLLCLAGTEQLIASRAKGGTSVCPVCGTKTADIRSHMGVHILRVMRGVSEPKEPIERITGSLPCGFCGHTGEPSCTVTMREFSKSIQYSTNCPRMEKFQYASAAKGSNNRPCRNVPVVCKLCVHDGRETDSRPGVWRYNMEAHLDYQHPEYSHPGKPDGRPLPFDVYESIYLTDEEQRLANVTPRPVFTNILEKENDNRGALNARAKKRKQDAETLAAAAASGSSKRGRLG